MTRDQHNRIVARLRQGWCQGELARNSRGSRVHFASDEAVEWCMTGASLRERMFEKITNPPQPYTNWVAWNDAPGRTQAEVIAMVESWPVEEG